MKIAWWFGQCSDHSIHIQMILVFGKTVRDCVRVKKMLMKQKANEEEKNLAMINNSLQDSTITPKISSLLKALIQIKILHTKFWSVQSTADRYV